MNAGRIAGLDTALMIDVGYRWKNANEALWVLQRLEEDKLFFVETPLHTDDLDGLARLADATIDSGCSRRVPADPPRIS